MKYDAVIVGSGPNGFAAAITLARRGRSVLVLEAADTVGGGMRSAEWTLPGFLHDACSAIHPLGLASLFFRSTPLGDFGLEWIFPEIEAAHPLPDGSAAAVYRSLDETASQFGRDAESYRRLMDPLLASGESILDQVLGPLRVPKDPWSMARFGLRGVTSARRFVDKWFRDPRTRAMFAGMAAHSVLPLDSWLTAAVGLMFCLTAHHRGWPLPRGGSQRIAAAMESYLRSLGGEVITGNRVASLRDIPSARVILFDIAPRNFARIAGEILPAGYRRKLDQFRHGPGVFKLDWALAGPIPWTNALCRRAGTIHVGGTFEEIADAEKAAWTTSPSDQPFVLVTQSSLFDPTRAPAGQHTGWAYCHVPPGFTGDMTNAIESQIERFAPGFRDQILARHFMSPREYEQYNENYIGGDITGGIMDLRQLLRRPTSLRHPYSTPVRNLFLCSSSTPPGGGVHGMCGYFAAQTALRDSALWK